MNEFDIKSLMAKGMEDNLVKLLIENTPVAYIILDEEYRVHFINESFLKLRKLKREDVIGEICYNISNGGKPCKHCTVFNSWQSGEKTFTLRKDNLPDGSVRYIDDYAIPLKKKHPDDPSFMLELMVDRTKEMVERESRDKEYDEILSLLSNLLEVKDEYTARHSANVKQLAYNLASALNFDSEEMFEISIAASLHDLGKIKIPKEIINKPGKLTDEEYEIIKYHPVASYEMIEDLSSFEDIKHIVRHHHERYDGKGYPDGLKGDEAGLASKIVAVVDAYEAMTSTRSYRKALSHEYAMSQLVKGSGTQFDPKVVEAFEGLDFTSFGVPPKSKSQSKDSSSVERFIFSGVQNNVCKPTDFKETSSKLDMTFLLNEIFKHTPCGYVLMDVNKNVLYASDFFLNFMGLDKSEVYGRKCYQAGCMTNTACRPCSIEDAIISGKVEYMRQEQLTRNGHKTFDLYGMPLVNPDGTIEYVIEVIIDRTDEVNLEKSRNEDFKKLIKMLNELPEIQALISEDAVLAERIKNLNNKID